MQHASSLRERTTTLLSEVGGDGARTVDDLLPLIYEELRSMAHEQLRDERDGHTLHTTALVHEAYLRLVDDTAVTERGRGYFFGAAARAMRQVLVDYARRRTAQKRGAGVAPLDLDEQHLSVDAFATELIDLHKALERLAALNLRHAQVAECRFFGGLSIEETALALDISPRTVHYDWALARAWLYDALHDPLPDS